MIFPDDPPSSSAASAQLAAMLRERRAILFDGARFDPLLHGEPDLSAFVRQDAAYDDLAASAPRHAVVQFLSAPGPKEVTDLRSAGLEVLFYVPHDAYLVRGDAIALAAARSLPTVRWIGRYRPGYKVDRALARLSAGLIPRNLLPGEGADGLSLDLLLSPGVSPEGVVAAIENAAPGVEILASLYDGKIGVVMVRIPKNRLTIDVSLLANIEDVLAVEPHGDATHHNDDAVWIGQSYDLTNRLNYALSATIWKHGLLGDGEIIGISDTGIDPDVCWMEDPLGLPTPSSVPATGVNRGPIPTDPSRRKIIAYNLLSSFQASSVAYDVTSGNPHGTWAAISAAGDNPDNPASEADPLGPHHDPADGMAPMAKLVVEDLGDAEGNLVGLGLPLPLIIDQMFEQMRDAGARIATNSWGIDGNGYDVLTFFTDRMAWNYPDFLIVFSAGNSGPYERTIASPATGKNVLAVGASEARWSPTENLDPENLAEFSARGPTQDGRLKPEIIMSGHKLVTGDSDLGETGRTCITQEVSGTSFAAPLVAGFASLVREYYRKGFYPTGIETTSDGFIPSAALLRASLIAGARNMVGSAGQDYSPCILDTCDVAFGLCVNVFKNCTQDSDCSVCNGNQNLTCSDDRDCDLSLLADDAPTNQQGFGRLHLDDVLYFDGDSRGLAVWDVPRNQGIGTGETWSSEVYVDASGSDLHVVLTWPDPPALIASPIFRVNDLDLTLIAPDGTRYHGNVLSPRDRDPFTREYTPADTERLDSLDVETIETVRLSGAGLASGMWTIEVRGDSVPGSPWIDGDSTRQDFAVVAVGPVSNDGGRVSFTKSRWACSGDLTVQVRDTNASEPLSVTVTTLSGDSETVNMSALGGGLFEGTLTMVTGAEIQSSDAVLQVAAGERLFARYDDSSPALTARDEAMAQCRGSLNVGSIAISGGCDGDGFLDAGELADLSVTLVNPGPEDLTSVSARLASASPDLFVVSDTATFGSIPAGTSATSGTNFQVSLRNGATFGETRALTLLVSSDGWTEEAVLPIVLDVETDRVTTLGTYSEDFSSATLQCHDGSSEAPTDQWYRFDPDQDCNTAEDDWAFGLCFGDPMALLPSCNSSIIDGPGQNNHILASPQISTGDPGTTTVLKSIRFTEHYDFRINQGGRRCDRVVVEIFTNRDGRTSPSGYYRDVSADGSGDAVDLDPTRVAEWNAPPLPDATLFQLIFKLATDDPATGESNCAGTEPEDFFWRLDDVFVDYENVADVADQSAACDPGCTSPGTPTDIDLESVGAGRLLVGWDEVPGADHYDLYRDDGGGMSFVARIRAPDHAYLDSPPGSGPWSYEVEAVDSTGLCFSPRSTTASYDGAVVCSDPPDALAGLSITDDEQSTCQMTLNWDAASSACAGPVSYRVYRSLDPDFVPGPQTLLGETTSTTWVDSALSSGWDADGEPRGDLWTYEVRAFDATSGLEGAGGRTTGRPGGPRQNGTWIDDGGDLKPSKVAFEVSMDEFDSNAGWSRSPIALKHGGNWSYWSDAESTGDGRYAPLACFSMVSPEIKLDPAGNPQLSIWVNYEIEFQWDGLVIELAENGGAFAPIDPIGGYPDTFAQTQAPPCLGTPGGTGDWINGCDYPPTQGCITGPAAGGLSGWEEYVFDLSARAGSTVQFKVKMSTDCGTDGGVVVDDVSVSDALLSTECATGSCLPAPTFTGILSARDVDTFALTGIEVSWGDVDDWGGGGPGTFVVYRDGEEIATLADSARTYLDLDAAANQKHTYQVIARSGSGCELPSASTARLRSEDCGALDTAGLDAARVNVARSPDGDTIILRAEPLPGALTYRFPWSQDPATVSGSSDVLTSGTPEARHDVALDGLNYFYQVEDAPSENCP